MGQLKFVLSNTAQVYLIMFRPVLRPFSHMSAQEHTQEDTIEIYVASSHIHYFYSVTISYRMYDVQNTIPMSLLKMYV